MSATKAQRRGWPYLLPVAVMMVALVLTAALVLVSEHQYTSNEHRLLDLRVRELGSVLTEALPAIQTPLASAAALADATSGNPAKFERFIAPYVGPPPRGQFVSVSLWRAGRLASGPAAVVGKPPALSTAPAHERAFLTRAAGNSKMSVVGLEPPLVMRLGFAVPAPRSSQRFVVYGETQIPADRRSRLRKNQAFSDLDYALYLGRSTHSSDLLVTDLDRLPIEAHHASQRIPFGDAVLTLVVAAREPLAGTLPQRLPWIVLGVGVLLALAAAGLTYRLTARRRAAESLASRLEHALEENRRLYAEQRDIASTLQSALLPDELPHIEGAQASAHYAPGEQGVEIGGDWYDLIPVDGDRVLVVVGDVSGHGLAAASTMASLRYAIHAYAAQDDPPDAILDKLSKLLDVTSSGRLATVLCALIDVHGRTLTLASAGHLPPLMVDEHGGRYLEGKVGIPIGVAGARPYRSTTVSAPPAATFLAFTDGLVERRGESLDQGLERLRRAASQNGQDLEGLLQRLVSELHHEHSNDDTAIVGLRWND